MRDRIRGAIFGARKGIGLGEACFVRWAIMNIMAIEDGLFPLAYVTHTIKYLQQCKFSRSIKTRANNWLNYVSSSLNSCGGERRWQSTTVWADVDVGNLHACVFLYVYLWGLQVVGVASTLSAVTWMEEVYCGTVAQMKENIKKDARRGPTSTLPHVAPLDVGTVFTVTFLEDKVELNNMSSLSHISPKHTLRHLNVCLLKET